MEKLILKDLISKYNVPGPRYTSYPTVPYWEGEGLSEETWKAHVKSSFAVSNSSQGISLYIHLPFCESLCTFCGCNKRITKNHSVEEVYLKAVVKEWKMYRSILPGIPKITDIHFGGGSPTFFSAENLGKLLDGIFEGAEKGENASFSIEGHPNYTREDQLVTLYNYGFRRISFGIQDFDPRVQEVINRIQPFENVENATYLARKVGFTSVNYDIIYGLPLQKEESIIDTIQKVGKLRPDRIAFYSYAHVPWIKGVGQRKFTEEDLPKGPEKRKLYETGKEMLGDLRYEEIGMDHFALITDKLYNSMKEKNLHRNFMGYVDSKTELMIGLGVSSISDSWTCFAQNVKSVEAYYKLLEEKKLPIFRGHELNPEDLLVRKHILELICNFETKLNLSDWNENDFEKIEWSMRDFVNDGILTFQDGIIKVLEEGKPFIRNICMALDLRLFRAKPETQLFSMTI
ncbi:oxygen-independent coproporphyrinogen III oxidase [Flexithrix dorotheae]|uniref:oxygen-independent coproporphyrinogen III oxidase n=1 Tax=Flexithrix dorotheae TaxID=70993 RepID=UPI000372DB02|nr:oxygen-independent coproporphyrinogen III oxidase [Flexithrix dorotheae]